MDIFKNRSQIISAIFTLAAIVLIVKLVFLQLVDNSYASIANDNVVKTITNYPTRGLVYDRNGELVVYNEPVYDIMIETRQVKDLDTALFCKLLGITIEGFNERIKSIKKQRHYASYRGMVFMKQVPIKTYARYEELMYKFQGFYALPRTKRRYPHSVAAHIFGDIGEVDTSVINNDSYYSLGDYAGNSGLEKTYEKTLRGRKGKQYIIVDVLNRKQGKFRNGTLDTLPEAGLNLQATIDIALQQYGELLMQNKKGSIVAIDPATGEILAFVSSPAFDPNILAGDERGKNYKTLQSDTIKPLFNRPIMAQYPPGSTFKAFVALVALKNKSIKTTFGWRCPGYYTIPGYVLSCSHSHPSAGNVRQGLQHSCNPYFWQTFRNSLEKSQIPDFEESYDSWYKNIKDFGFDQHLGVDLIGEKKGNVPGPDYYNDLYGNNAWKATTIISLGIGQGELLVTPLQLANAYACIANNGVYIQPHLVRQVFNDNIDSLLRYPVFKTNIDTNYFNVVVDGLADVVDYGTARRSKIPDITMCGKTGTAQNPHGDDHSIFAGFAPKEKPSIVVATIVENAGGGSKMAAPISSLMIEMYLNDTIHHTRKYLEETVLETDLIHTKKEDEL